MDSEQTSQWVTEQLKAKKEGKLTDEQSALLALVIQGCATPVKKGEPYYSLPREAYVRPPAEE